MNQSTAEGKFDQFAGKIKQSIGEAIGNQDLANSGAADQVKGVAKEAWGNAKDAAHAVSQQATATVGLHRAEAQARTEETAHNVRESIVNSAKNAKDAISDKLDDVKHNPSHVG